MVKKQETSKSHDKIRLLLDRQRLLLEYWKNVEYNNLWSFFTIFGALVLISINYDIKNWSWEFWVILIVLILMVVKTIKRSRNNDKEMENIKRNIEALNI